MVRYAIQMVDMKGTAIEPGVDGSIYRSETPLPIPFAGDTVLSFNRHWKVEKLIYEYTNDEDTDETVTGVTIQCSRIPD